MMLYQLALEIIKATEKYAPRMCWRNAVEALLTSNHPALEEAIYVEGWAIPVSTGVPVEHGWLELANGEVLDITWLDCEAQYFAGAEYTREQLEAVDPDKLPLVWVNNGWGGMQHVGYKHAYFKALEASIEKEQQCLKRKRRYTLLLVAIYVMHARRLE